MGIDAIALVGHSLDWDSIQRLPQILTKQRFPQLYQLAWQHPHWSQLSGRTVKPRTFNWIIPKVYTNLEAAWLAEQEVELDAGDISLQCYQQVVRINLNLHWYWYVVRSDVQQACSAACYEWVQAFGGDRCIHLADIVDDRDSMMSLEEAEELLQRELGEPVATLSNLYEGGLASGSCYPNKRDVSCCNYFVERFYANQN